MTKQKTISPTISIDGNDYTWDGQSFYDKNKAKTQARRYLRQGLKVHMESENGNYFLFRWRPWPTHPVRPDNRETIEAAREQ
jgi:hypothetical protein